MFFYLFSIRFGFLEWRLAFRWVVCVRYEHQVVVAYAVALAADAWIVFMRLSVVLGAHCIVLLLFLVFHYGVGIRAFNLGQHCILNIMLYKVLLGC